MKFDASFVRLVLNRLFEDTYVDFSEAEAIYKVLGSREELLAWILLSKNYASRYPEVGNALLHASSSVVVNGASRRIRSDYPLFDQDEMLSLEMALRSLVNDSANTSQDLVSNANNSLISVASRHGVFELLGPMLKINKI